MPHARLGKLIVATEEAEIPGVEKIEAAARANGVTNLEWLTASRGAAARTRAELRRGAAVALDRHHRQPRADARLSGRGRGSRRLCRVPLAGTGAAGCAADGFELEVGGDEPATIRCRILVNAAGLYAPALARAIDGVPPETIPPAYFCRGVYFTLAGKTPFRRLIYPVPVPGGLGVHITLDLAGQARFGPDVEWIPDVDYAVDPRRGDAFYAAVRRYWPGLRDGALQPGYAGIRPKISGPNEAAADFVVQGPEAHGVPGLVNLYGIESPGLTASLPLADEVLRKLG